MPNLHSGVIAKRYKEIREGIHSIVVENLFDPVALKEHFSGRKKYIQEMLHLGMQIDSLYETVEPPNKGHTGDNINLLIFPL